MAKRRKISRLLKITIAIGIATPLLLAGSVFSYPQIYRHKIFPGVQVGSIPLGGQTFLEALETLEKPMTTFHEKGIVFRFEEKEVAIPSTLPGTDIDSSIEILSFDSQTTIAEAYRVGRKKDFFQNLQEQIHALFYRYTVALEYTWNPKEIERSLQENFKQFETAHEDAALVVHPDLSFGIKEEKEGRVFDYPAIIEIVKTKVQSLDVDPIVLTLIADSPRVTMLEAKNLLPEANRRLDFAPFDLRFEDKRWTIEKKSFATWLMIQPAASTLEVGLDRERITSTLNSIGQEINIEAKNGRFHVENGKVVEFEASAPGRKLNIEKNIRDIEEVFGNNKRTTVNLAVDTEEPEITLTKINDLGIRELIGVGKSNFAGSPVNRRSNIKTGAEKIDGILIKPDEEFSLLKALGNFNPEEGWLKELVIKGNRTIPEIGGGACQFGTTMFRSAMNAGLPIIARRNHSYTVSYYYPIGTDATIYDPAPDFKFVNDTGNFILLQTKIENDNLIFEIWGTKDGRRATQTDPRLFDWKDPPPMKIIETEDLKPGEEKCTEKPHKGVSAEFIYQVRYPNGETKEQVFRSKYKPWQKVCLRGIRKKTP